MGGALNIPLKFICGNETKQKINNIENDIANIKENHLHTIQKDINEMKTDIKIIKEGILNIRFGN